MIAAKKQVDILNASRELETQATFTGDFVQSQMPLNKDGTLITGEGGRIYIGWYKFEAGTWTLGGM